MTETRRELTFQYNLTKGRHGWLRLTPAYSVKLVNDILDRAETNPRLILDPFSGTGTTGLVAAERGLACDLVEINPFLVWLAEVKTANYSADDIDDAESAAEEIAGEGDDFVSDNTLWTPPIHDVHRWWPENKLCVLAKIHRSIHTRYPFRSPVRDLLLVAFCRLIIDASNAAFNHQSMSFKTENAQLPLDETANYLFHDFENIVRGVLKGAQEELTGCAKVMWGDARSLTPLEAREYDCVITSPPYPNRMSYIREVRPYMYWLGYLNEAREAGELDWSAIGGTWGIATSRLNDWMPDASLESIELEQYLEKISLHSPLLANYVHKYFQDISTHLKAVFDRLVPGARVYYIVGNSKFYDTIVPVDVLYAQLLSDAGFSDVKVDTLRKRNSKKELYEYLISARKR